MNKHVIYLIIIALLLILCFDFWRQNKADQKMLENNMEVMNDSIAYYRNSLDQEVAERKSFQGTNKELEQIIKQQGLQFNKSLKNIKKPTAATKIITETKIDTVFIPYKIEAPLFSISFNEIKKHYSISGLSTNKGLSIHSLAIPNEQSIVIGQKKIGFWKYEYRAEVTNSNPLIKVKELASFDFQERKKRFVIGPFLGFDPNPRIGIGISYKLLEF